MSLEAWGDDDGAGDYDHLLEAGWWPSERAEEVTEAIKALVAERVYEDGQKDKGISERFLARITLLQATAGLDISQAMIDDAERVLNECRENERHG